MKILCDFDGEIPPDVSARVQMVSRVLGFTLEYVRFDRTRHGYHMIVSCEGPRLKPVELVLVQALLGSDWKRETFNARRARTLSRHPFLWRKGPRWNVLYHSHSRRVTL